MQQMCDQFFQDTHHSVLLTQAEINFDFAPDKELAKKAFTSHKSEFLMLDGWPGIN
jgi:hypothetical protein